MSNASFLRRSLGMGYLLTGILYGVTILVALACAAVTVGVARGVPAPEAQLRELRGIVDDVLTSAGLLSAEPSRTRWDQLHRQNERLAAASRRLLDRGRGGERELDRLVLTALAERFVRLEDVVDKGTLERMAAAATPAAEVVQLRRSLEEPAANYLQTTELVLAEADRELADAAARRSSALALLLVLAVLLESLGLAGATLFLVAFARATLADARILSSYGAKMARGEYPDDPLPVRPDALGELASSLKMLTRLEKALYDVRDLGATFEGSARQLDTQAAQTLSRISVQTSRIESAVRMLDDIVQAIQSVYTNARRSLDTAEESGTEIGKSIEKLLQGASDVEQLGKLTNRIEEIVALISSIADQTDILSLNAGIEAARAGPYGRGFTVVASEVRKLADKSGRSALEISELTQSILSVVQKIAARTDEESFVMSAIQKGLTRITEAVGEVTEVSGAARDNVERLSKSIDEITGGIIDAQREAGEITKIVHTLRADVGRLRGLSAELGFSVSTASFAAWAANAAAQPAPESPRESAVPPAAEQPLTVQPEPQAARAPAAAGEAGRDTRVVSAQPAGSEEKPADTASRESAEEQAEEIAELESVD